MALLKIRHYPDPVLKTKAAPVEEIDGELQTLIDTMAETMYAAPGIGLAANQVGKSGRVVGFDMTPDMLDRARRNLDGSDYQLIDGMTYLWTGAITPLKISGDYPEWNYKYTGTVEGIEGCISSFFDVFLEINTVPAPAITLPC